METYITLASATPFQTINPFWNAVEKEWIKPEQCRIFYVKEHSKELQEIMKWMQEVYLQYNKKSSVNFHAHVFDDENITAFVQAIKDVIRMEVESGNKVVMDITSASWNYIPAAFMLIADENRDIVKSILYHQVSQPSYLEMPYPLIPYTEQRLYNLLQIEALEEVAL